MKIVECPRDAMQGIKEFIPTEIKAAYINQLLKVGFDTLDFGSFVSPKAIPQMQDTADLLKQLELSDTSTKLLAIIANQRGAEEASVFEEIKYLGYPFSISETFQLRNTNATIAQSLIRVEEIQAIALKNKKELVVYVSMAFGNPYGDKWNPEIAIDWSKRLHEMGVNIIALADTIGVSDKTNIAHLFSSLIPELPKVEFGAHLHSRKESAMEKISTAYDNGCKRFDVAIHGFGGCPMAEDDLTGNTATEVLEDFLLSRKINNDLNLIALQECYKSSWDIFNKYH